MNGLFRYIVGVLWAIRHLTGAQAVFAATHPKAARRLPLPAMAGADPIAEQLVAARTEERSAVEAMEQASEAIQNAGDDADVDALRSAFDTAEERYNDAIGNRRRLESVAEARSNLPAAPAEDGDGDGADDEQRGGGDARVVNEPMTYERGGPNSFFSDMFNARVNDDPNARGRLDQHAKEVGEARALSTAAGAGGQFVPPTWMNDEFIALARSGRVTANLVRRMPLPDGVNTINVPKVVTGAATATQTDNNPVQSTDPTTDSIAVPVRTNAGQVDVSRQLVDRAQPTIDDILFGDLTADYAQKINAQVLTGSGVAPNATGITQTASIEAVSYTDASPTVPEFYAKLADAVYNRVGTLRLLPADAIVMHPRRWGWLVASLDSSNRPLIVPTGGALAPLGTSSANGGRVDMTTEAGEPVAVGTILGVPVYLDPGVPTNLGAGTNEDLVLVLRTPDLYLWEGDVNENTYFEVLSGSLGVRFQVYGYFAFTAARYPKSVATVGGTGLVAPTF